MFVDLDGTLIDTDLLFEAFFALLRSRPLYCLLVPYWLLRGKAHMKHRIAQLVEIDVASIPFNKQFLDHLRSEAAAGRELILATASNRLLADKVAEHLDVFSAVLASDADTNLSGELKLMEIQRTSGGKPFDYAANAWVDLAIWRHSRKALLVNPRRSLVQAAREVTDVEHVFPGKNTGFVVYAKAMRIYQWMKNLLLFVPLFTSHKFHDLQLVSTAALAFLAFSLCSSGVYVLNDLLDLQADRAHPRKRSRPFAAGTLPLSHGLLLAFLSPLTGLAIALLLSTDFFFLLLLYMLLTSAYSISFKAYALVDVLLLATLYTLRIFAGAVVIGVTLSFWLLTFSMFIFLSLALVKRCSELAMMTATNKTTMSGRGYQTDDLANLQMMGIASGYMSILVIALYIDNPTVTELYTHPQMLWLLCPVLLFWISRIWLKTGRGEMHDDPLIFAIKDRGSHLTALLCVVTVLLAM